MIHNAKMWWTFFSRVEGGLKNVSEIETVKLGRLLGWIDIRADSREFLAVGFGGIQTLEKQTTIPGLLSIFKVGEG